ncbi:MAG: fluoride efflux transporter CrcB [Prevotella sp.]|jgi:CrcB protein
MKEFLIVGLGSFLGGGSRYAVSQLMKSVFGSATPMGTLTVNIVGCFLIGLLSAMSFDGRWLTPAMRLVLVTGFCGGFTTFSTFMSENAGLLQNRDYMIFAAYLLASLLLGFAALVGGHELARMV